jgi:hypothetical protein
LLLLFPHFHLLDGLLAQQLLVVVVVGVWVKEKGWDRMG